MLAVYIITSVVCVFVIKCLLHFKEFRKIYNKLPGDTDFHPLLGTIHKYPGFNEDGLMFDFENTRKYKYFCRVWMGPFLAVVQAFHPDTVRHIIKCTSFKPRNMGLMNSGYDMGIPWLGEGMILANGPRWYRSRRLLTPAFHFDILKKYMKVYNSCSNLLEHNISEMTKSGSSVDLQSIVSNYTLDVILRCAFSYNSKCQSTKEPSEYTKAISEMQYTWTQRILNPLKYNEFLYSWTPEGRRFYHLCDLAHKEAEGVIAKRKSELASNPDLLTGLGARDFLDTLLTARDEEGNGLSDLEIRNEVDTFMFAGHDTTASGIMWTLMCLSQHPEYQEQVYREVSEVIGGQPEVKWEDLSKLQFTTQCIKEALRLHSAVPVIERITTEDTMLQGYTIPQGTRVTLHLWMLHHNPHVWDEPHKFLPDRFHPDKVTQMDPYQFMPFSAGARNCIGQNFAMNEMKVTVSKVISRFKLRADPDKCPERNTSITMKSLTGAHVFATPRCSPEATM